MGEDILRFFDDTSFIELLLPAAIPLAVLVAVGIAYIRRRATRLRRLRRINKAGGVDEWQAALAIEEPEEKPVPWLHHVGNATLGLGAGALAYFADSLFDFAIGGAALFVGISGWEWFIKRYYTAHVPEKEEPDEDMQFFGFIIIGALLMFGALAAIT